ncbi:MAG: F0F1 ATP synthase subunit B [Chloroflexi bacterium]|nr:F0F1 ATP synthase subunit B [Chloroflexota bacterium]
MDKLGINLPWFLTQLTGFLIVLFILRQFTYKPILNMLETRKRKIAESLEYADKVKADAAAQQKDFERRLDEARREAQVAAQSAQQAAEQERQRILAEAQAEAAKIKEAARGELDYERKQMVSELRQQVIDLSVLGAQRVIGANLDDRKSRQLVENFLNEMDFGANGRKPASTREGAGA